MGKQWKQCQTLFFGAPKLLQMVITAMKLKDTYSLEEGVKEESEKVALKLNIQKTKIMASGPITLWQIDGETENSGRLRFWGSKITGDSDCSHEIKITCSLEEKL